MEGARTIRLVVATASVLLAVLLPGVADAATVHVGQAPDSPYPCCRFGGSYSSAEQAAYFLAAPGERNDVSVTNDRPQGQPVQVTFHDEGAKVEAGEGCVPVDDHTARCSGSRVTVAQAQLGDEDDKLHVFEPTKFLGLLGAVRAFGGKGDDLLVGGPFSDELYGGGGRDELHGGDFRDVLSDGDRSGAKGEARPGPDVMDGGPGYGDVISYGQRTARVTVDLRTGAAGEKGEGDATSGFEYAAGGAGGDRLTGDNQANDLFGNGGNDVLRGLRGQNSLHGGRGRDRLIGDNESDFLAPGPGIDSVSCGGSPDTVRSPAAGELLRRECEAIDFAPPRGSTAWNTFGLEPYPTSVSRTAATFGIDCPQFDPGEEFEIKPCAGTVTLRKAHGRHVLLGRARKTDNGPYFVRVKLTAAGRRLVHRKGGVVTTVSLRGAKSAGNPLPKVAWTIRLEG